MNRANVIISFVSLVVSLSLVGIIVWEQFEILRLQGRNEELLISNSYKDQEITDLGDSYKQLNSSYFQTLNSLQQLTVMLNASDSNLSELQQDYLNLTNSYNDLKNSLTQLRSTIIDYSEDLGGEDGVWIVNYTWVYSGGVVVRHSITVELYNLLEPCMVTVKVWDYGSTSKVFMYNMPSGRDTFVETWDGSQYIEYYSQITLNVTRT